MKNLLTITLLLLSFYSKAQSKDTGTKYDTVVTSHDYLIILDSSSYSNLISLIGSITASQNKSAGFILNSVDGSRKNIFLQPHFALKPKNKK